MPSEHAAELAEQASRLLAAGNVPGAIQRFEEAVALDPADAELRNLLGNAFVHAGRAADARRSYQAAAELDPLSHKPHANLGRIALDEGDLIAARGSLERAIALNPDAARPRKALAEVLARLGDPERAIEQLSRFLHAFPGEIRAIDEIMALGTIAASPRSLPILSHAFALDPAPARGLGLASLLLANGQPTQALAVCRRVEQSALGNSDAAVLRERILKTLGPPSEADVPRDPASIDDLLTRVGRSAASGNPQGLEEAILSRHAQPWSLRQRYELAQYFQQAGRHGEAIAELTPVVAEAPELLDARTRWAQSLLSLGRPLDAIRVMEPVADQATGELKPGVVLARALRQSSRIHEAHQLLQGLVRRFPRAPRLHHELVVCLAAVGRLERAAAHVRFLHLIDPDGMTHETELMTLQYRRGGGPLQIALRHAEWSRATFPADARSPRIASAAHDRLRIGYVSADLRSHPVARFLLPILRHHDRRSVEVFAYSNADRSDATTAVIRSLVDHWRDVSALNAPTVAARVMADEVDVLVDLSGHSGDHRLDVFALRPAPASVTFLGYPGTTGLEQVDFRLTDALADPPGMTDDYHTERLLRLPRCAWSYEPQNPSQPQRLPRAPDVAVRFASFNNHAKLSPETLACWAELLRRIPSARLQLKSVAGNDPRMRSELVEWLRAQGMAVERIDFMSWLPDPLESYGSVDIALDPFPYNGTTTTCDALYSGVPVITLAGDAHVSRVGVSLLHNVGLGDLVADSPEQYVEIACRLAADPDRLEAIHRQLRERAIGGLLGDPRAFTREFEQALRAAFESKQRQEQRPLPQPARLSDAHRHIVIGSNRVVAFDRQDLIGADDAYVRQRRWLPIERVLRQLSDEHTCFVHVGAAHAHVLGRLAEAGARGVMFATAADPVGLRLLEAARTVSSAPWLEIGPPPAETGTNAVRVVIASAPEAFAPASTVPRIVVPADLRSGSRFDRREWVPLAAVPAIPCFAVLADETTEMPQAWCRRSELGSLIDAGWVVIPAPAKVDTEVHEAPIPWPFGRDRPRVPARVEEAERCRARAGDGRRYTTAERAGWALRSRTLALEPLPEGARIEEALARLDLLGDCSGSVVLPAAVAAARLLLSSSSPADMVVPVDTDLPPFTKPTVERWLCGVLLDAGCPLTRPELRGLLERLEARGGLHDFCARALEAVTFQGLVGAAVAAPKSPS